MAIFLKRLTVAGPGIPNAEIHFDTFRTLIRGPSDTGKSYIRDCLWYLLDGKKQPKHIPQARGYESMSLTFASDGVDYAVRRALAGGTAEILQISSEVEDQSIPTPLPIELGKFFVKLAGGSTAKLLRGQSDRGALTGDDLRHWFLLSQPSVISEEPTSGSDAVLVTKHVSAFNYFLTGRDDSALKINKSSKEVERIRGQLTSAEDMLSRLSSGLPPGVLRTDISDALERVDASLSSMTRHFDARAVNLRGVRSRISATSSKLALASSNRRHSASMVDRFTLLNDKYSSDLERLGATNEGIAMFDALSTTPCPLCGSDIEQQVKLQDLRADAPSQYRTAIAAEADKIVALRVGLVQSLVLEKTRLAELAEECRQGVSDLELLEREEQGELVDVQVAGGSDPHMLAVRRSELSAQLSIFDEQERLNTEIARLNVAKKMTRVVVARDGGADGNDVARIAAALLRRWGFDDVQTVSLDATKCDLLINGRDRLSYGAGRRAIFLTALTIALLQHAMTAGRPHLGVVVIDSPLKAYADADADLDANAGSSSAPAADQRVAASTVTENFYSWLASWAGPGQIVILENEKIRESDAQTLAPVEFTGRRDVGREGFFPIATPLP